MHHKPNWLIDNHHQVIFPNDREFNWLSNPGILRAQGRLSDKFLSSLREIYTEALAASGEDDRQSIVQRISQDKRLYLPVLAVIAIFVTIFPFVFGTIFKIGDKSNKLLDRFFVNPFPFFHGS